MLGYAQQEYMNLMYIFVQDESIILAQLLELLRSYNRPIVRVYHTMSHIEYMLKLLEDNNISKLTPNPDILKIGIFYHDYEYGADIYAPEAESIVKFLGITPILNLTSAEIRDICNMILCTATHSVLPWQSDNCRLLVDLDLAIFGDTPEMYDAYKNKIRKEYEMFNDQIFATRRLAVLKYI